MKRIWLWLCTLLLLTACDGVYSGTLVFEGDHRFEPGVRLPGDVLVRAGMADFAEGAQVDGMLVMLGGTVTLDGRVAGDVLLLDGSLVLGPTAVVGGDLRLGGGALRMAETAVVRGAVLENSGLALPLDGDQRSTPDDLARSLVAALLLALLGALWVRWKPRPVVAVGQAATQAPLLCGALGLLVLLVVPALLVVMAFTVLLVPLVVVIGGVLFVLLGYGLTAVGLQLGLRLARLAGRSLSAAQATFGGTLLLMLLFELPWVGAVAWWITAVVICGALLVTRLGLQPYTPTATPPELADYARPPAG